MSKVKVSYYGMILQKVTSDHEEEVYLSGENTVRDLLKILAEKHGDEFRESILTPDGQLQTAAIVQYDGHDINEIAGLDTKLGDNSELSIMLIAYMVTGG
jgi:molybdopterin converting factor small subunit